MKFIFILFHIIICLVFEGILLWLFPYTGLGGIICWPSTILLSVLSAAILFKIYGKITSFGRRSGILLLSILIQAYVQMSLMPQDYGGGVLKKTLSAVKGFSSYEEIEYSNFPSLSLGERVAFIHKFRKDLPDSFLVLTVSKQDDSLSSNRKYLLEKVNKVLRYDRSSLGISLQDDQTLITEYLANGDTIIHAADKDFFNRSSVGFQNEQHFISLDEDKWELNLGIEKLLYQMFIYSKKDPVTP